MQRGALPSYQQALSAIGRYLDQRHYDDLVLCELGDGFVGRVTQEGKLVEAIPFQAADLASMVRAAADEAGRAKTLVPPAPNPSGSFVRRTIGGYREFLTALGRQFDDLDARSVLVLELPASVLVLFRRPSDAVGVGQSANAEFLYDESGVQRLMVASATGKRA